MIKVEKGMFKIEGTVPVIAAEIATVVIEFKKMINDTTVPQFTKDAMIAAVKETINSALEEGSEGVRKNNEKRLQEHPELREEVENFAKKMMENY